MKRLVLAATLLLAAPAPAHAGELGRVDLGSRISDVVADPAGGAWVLSSAFGDRTVATRLDAGRPARRTAVRGGAGAAALGPDGALWFDVRGRVLRVDREARRSTVTAFPGTESIEHAMAAAPDGTMWSVASVSGRLARIAPNGLLSVSPFPAPACEGTDIRDAARASDGAMWFADADCHRLIRVGADGTSVIPLGELEPDRLEPDPTGGMWFLGVDLVGHSGGARHAVENVRDIAVLPDGAVLAADGSCTLTRVGGGAPVRAPLPTDRLEVANGTLYLAGATRVFAGLDGGSCDETPPKVTIRPRRLSLAAFKRGELRVTVKEPVDLVFFVEDPEFGFGKVMRKPGTYRVEPSRAALRRIAGKSRFYFVLTATDADGYDGGTDGYIRLTMP